MNSSTAPGASTPLSPLDVKADLKGDSKAEPRADSRGGLARAGLPRGGFHWGLGRRKSAVARVRIAPGSGDFLINGRPMTEFFPTIQMQLHALAPLKATATEGTYNVFCAVDGGGPVGQSGAVMLGLSRALKLANPSLETVLRAQGLLTRDSRMKERKKYGRRGARRGFQFSKR